MDTEIPTGPELGDRLVIPGATVKLTPLLAAEFTVTTTLPEVAPVGTGTTMLLALQLVGLAVVPLKVTVLVPWVAPKFVPVMVTEAPIIPDDGDKLEIPGVTVKPTPLLGAPLTLTTTLPVLAPLGTGAAMLVMLQLVGVAAVPLNVTVLEPWVEPKLAPLMVTEVVTRPDDGETPVIEGVMVKTAVVLAIPLTVTATLPVVAPEGTGTTILVALQLVGVAAVPLNVTVLLPCEEPKLVPVIVTEVPTGPELGDKPVMPGVTVKLTSLLWTAPELTWTDTVAGVMLEGTTIPML